MNTQILTFMTVIFLLSGGFVACEKSADNKIQATGTVIGSYSNGFGSFLVQVDEEYPIGGSIVVSSSFHPSDPDQYTYQSENLFFLQAVSERERR